MYHRILLAVVMPLVCCCVDLYAQTVDSTKTYHIEEVSVSAQRIRKEVIPVQMLAGEELQKLSVHSVADAIRYFSGIQIKDYGGIGGLKTVNIRGLGTQHVGVFYDGVQLGNAITDKSIWDVSRWITWRPFHSTMARRALSFNRRRTLLQPVLST